MHETTKTSIFLALAVVLTAVAFLSRPVVREVKMDEMIGKPLFQKFDDPLKVKKLEIVRNDAAGFPVDFRVSEVDGVWAIPSHDNYPADAKDQMGKVAEALIDLKVLDVVNMNEATDKTSLYTMYGVVDPTSESASLGEGIGVKVKLTGPNEEPLVDLIVGKEADRKENKIAEDPNESGKLRYVRVAGQTPIYVAEIDPKRFSTHFDQWIEKNLLDISTLDIKKIFVDEYSSKIETELVRTMQGVAPQQSLIPTFVGDFLLDYNGSGTGAEKWNLEKLMGFRGRNNQEYYAMSLKPNEELNTEVLDSMISALNDLKIVSVTKKPTVLATALKSGKPLEEIKDDPSLHKAGYYLISMRDMKSGTSLKKKQLLSSEGNIELRMKDGIRYSLRFGDLTGTESEIDAAKDEKKDAEKKPEAAPAMGVNRYLFLTTSFDETAIPPADIQPLKPLQEVPAEGAAEDLAKIKAENEKIDVENKQIEKSNQREQDRVKDAIEAGKKRTAKLNEKFADWYYVIPEDVYKKIHVNRTSIVREKTKKEEDDHDHADHDHAAPTPKLPTLPGMEGMLKVPGLDGPEDPAKPEAPKPEPKKEEPAKAEEAKPEPKKEEPAKPEEKKPEPPQSEPTKVEEPKPEPKKEEPAKLEEKKPEPSKPEPAEEKKEEKKNDEKPKEEKSDDKPFDPFGGDAPK